jgi:hypothetical protein
MAYIEVVRDARNIPAEQVDARREPVSRQRAEARMRLGNRLVISGFAVTLAGVVLYCIACLWGGMDRSMSELLFENVVPFAGLTLGVMGAGVALWFVGSYLYLSGGMDLPMDESKKS